MRSSGQTPDAPFNTFPLAPELILLVFSKLGARQLAILSLVSRETNVFASDNRLWFRLFSTNQSSSFDSNLNYKNSYKHKIQFTSILEKQSYHHGLARLLSSRTQAFPALRQHTHLLQRYDFAVLYSSLTETTDPALLNPKLPQALLGALVFEIKAMELSNNFMRTAFYTQLKANLRAACDEKVLSITEELEYLTAFAEFATHIPDTMLSDLSSWKNKAGLCAAIEKALDYVKEEQRQRCTMPY